MANVEVTPKIALLDPEFYVDPWEAYRWLRTESPVHRDEIAGIWGISRHEDVLALEIDPATYSSFPGSRPKLDQAEDRSMINLDDPSHQSQRKLVVRRFTPKAVRDHEAEARRFMDQIIEEATADGVGCLDAVEAVASRLPAMEIAHLLGYGVEQWSLIRAVSEFTMLLGGHTLPEGGIDMPAEGILAAAGAVMAEYYGATKELIAARRAVPKDDLVSIWSHTEVDGQPWDDDRISEEILLVLDGGAETTRTVIGSIMRELALRPGVQNELREDPSLLKESAVEEFIRWVAPISNMRRTATREHELRGQKVRPGDELMLLYGSANRDEKVFERPDEFDVRRSPNQHLSFGFGTHVCLGAPLARMELRIAFEQLLHRLPEWHLAPGSDPRIVPSTFARAYDAVQIEFEPSDVRPAG